MNPPTIKPENGQWKCEGVTRCPGGAVYAKGVGSTQDEAYDAWRRQTKSRVRAMEQEEATARWVVNVERGL